MPLPAAAVGPLIAGAAAVGSQGVNAYAQGRMNKKTREWNEKMYGLQRSHALVDWEMQNKYNSPAAQMERLRAAGLNPNLVYGHGATAEASPIRSTDVKGWNPQAPTFDAGSVMGAYMDTKVRQAQVDNLDAQHALLEQELANKRANEAKTYADIVLKGSQRDYTDTKTQLSGVDLQYAVRTKEISLEAMRAAINKTLQDTQKSKAETQFRLSENERRSVTTKMSLREAVERIALMRANALRAQAQTTNEFYRKQILMNQAIEIEKKMRGQDLQNQIREEELRLKQATPDAYEKWFMDATGELVEGLTSPGTRLNPKTYKGWTK